MTLESIPGCKLVSVGVRMRSGEPARRSGISTDSLRHYERLGLLPKPPRTSGGYRDYPASSLDRVQTVQRALRIGFSLPELVAILRLRDRGQAPCHQARNLAASKLKDLKLRIRDLTAMRHELEFILKDWDRRLAHAQGKPARLLETLPESRAGKPSFPDSVRRRRKK